jgi:hypothetical protein
MNTSILRASVLGPVLSASLFAQAYVDDFNSDSSALYTITSTGDAVATFAFDYSTLGIPVAPNTTDATTLGLKMEANIASGAVHGITLHTLIPFTGDFVVKFDAWMNANGPFPAGGTGSTEFLTMGVGGNGVATNGSGGWFAVSGEGGSSRDYRGYKNAAEQFAESGQFSAGLSSAGGGAHNNSNAYYSSFGGVDVGALPQAGLFPQQTGTTQAGAFGFAWHQVELRVVANGGTGGATSVTWFIDGLQIAKLDAGIGSPFVTNGSVTIGYMDIFSSISNNPALSFGLVDNLRIGAPATAATYGAGCHGIALSSSAPVIGGNWNLTTTGLTLFDGISFFGTGQQPIGVPLPLLGINSPGCEVWIDGLLADATATNVGGTSVLTIPVPNTSSLSGTVLTSQTVTLTVAAPSLIGISNGVSVTLGF